MKTQKTQKKANVDIEKLKQWKKINTRGKLEWLENALIFGKLKKFHL